MITRLLLNQPRRALAVALIALAATMTSGMAFAQADDEVMEGNPISLENVVFE